MTHKSIKQSGLMAGLRREQGRSTGGNNEEDLFVRMGWPGGEGNFSLQMPGKLRPGGWHGVGGWEGQSPSHGVALNVPMVLPSDAGMMDPVAQNWVLLWEMEEPGERRHSPGKWDTNRGV